MTHSGGQPTGSNEQAQDISQKFAEEFEKQLTLDREWSNGDELNNAASPVIEAAIRSAVTIAYETFKESVDKETKESPNPK